MVLANRAKLQNSRSLVRVFGGLNETYACSEAEYSAGVNFSARDFPALSTRKPRRKLRELTGLNGMYHLNGLLTVCGKDLIYTPDAVFGGPCGPLLNAFHHALLHSLRCSAQVFVVVGQTVRIPHPHAGQLHQAAHLRAAQLVLQIKIRLAAAHGRFLCRPAGMQAVHSSLCAAGKAGQRRQFWALHRQFLPGLFRLQLYGFLCRSLRRSGYFCFVRLHGAGGRRCTCHGHPLKRR